MKQTNKKSCKRWRHSSLFGHWRVKGSEILKEEKQAKMQDIFRLETYLQVLLTAWFDGRQNIRLMQKDLYGQIKIPMRVINSLIDLSEADLQWTKLFLCSLFMLEEWFTVTYYWDGTLISIPERKKDLPVCQDGVRKNKTKQKSCDTFFYLENRYHPSLVKATGSLRTHSLHLLLAMCVA